MNSKRPTKTASSIEINIDSSSLNDDGVDGVVHRRLAARNQPVFINVTWLFRLQFGRERPNPVKMRPNNRLIKKRSIPPTWSFRFNSSKLQRISRPNYQSTLIKSQIVKFDYLCQARQRLRTRSRDRWRHQRPPTGHVTLQRLRRCCRLAPIQMKATSVPSFQCNDRIWPTIAIFIADFIDSLHQWCDDDSVANSIVNCMRIHCARYLLDAIHLLIINWIRWQNFSEFFVVLSIDLN